MPHYRKYGKIVTPISEEEFKKGIVGGHFVKRKHKGYCVLLHYSAVRKMEALRVSEQQFRIMTDRIIFDVGERMKKQKSWFKETPALTLPLEAPFMEELKYAVDHTRTEERVFPYSAKTAYNIVSRVFKYPHLFRLSRITQFFLEGWTIPQVRAWTGLSLNALEYYVGLVDTIKMGESLARKK